MGATITIICREEQMEMTLLMEEQVTTTFGEILEAIY